MHSRQVIVNERERVGERQVLRNKSMKAVELRRKYTKALGKFLLLLEAPVIGDMII